MQRSDLDEEERSQLARRENEIINQYAEELFAEYLRNDNNIDTEFFRTKILSAVSTFINASVKPSNESWLKLRDQFIQKVQKHVESTPSLQAKLENHVGGLIKEKFQELEKGVSVHLSTLEDKFTTAIKFAGPSDKDRIEILKKDNITTTFDDIMSLRADILRFQGELWKQIDRIQQSTYGHPADRDRKILILRQLESHLLQNRYQKDDLATLISTFMNKESDVDVVLGPRPTNYEVLSRHRRESGFASLFNFGKTSTQKWLSQHFDTSTLVQKPKIKK